MNAEHVDAADVEHVERVDHVVVGNFEHADVAHIGHVDAEFAEDVEHIADIHGLGEFGHVRDDNVDDDDGGGGADFGVDNIVPVLP